MAYQLYLSGSKNQIFIKNLSNNNIYVGLAKNVVVTRSKSDSTKFYFVGFASWSRIKGINFSDLRDENENPFSDVDAFTSWFEQNTGFSQSSGGGQYDTEVEWMLSTPFFTTPVIAYGGTDIEVNSSGTIEPIGVDGTPPFLSYAVTSGSLPNEFSLDSETGVISYTTTGATSSGSFDIAATNGAGQGNSFTVNWSISQANGIAQFTNSENKYVFCRISTGNSIDTQILIKQEFFGKVTSTVDGTLIQDSAYPIYVADNGNSTWNYFVYIDGYSYRNLYLNSTTNPSSLSDGFVTDLTTGTLAYDLVSPNSDEFLFDGVNYPSDQGDVHWGTTQKYLSAGTDSSFDGFMGGDTTWSYGFRLTEDMPDDALGRVMFAREGRNWIGFYIGQNGTYTNMIFGNGSNSSYDGDDSYPSGGFSSGDYVKVTHSSYLTTIKVNGTTIFSYNTGFSLDGAVSSDSLPLHFGRGVESNAWQYYDSYYHGFWQGKIDRLWICNGQEILTDDDGGTYPTGTTHAWNLTETTGKDFAAAIGSVNLTGQTL